MSGPNRRAERERERREAAEAEEARRALASQRRQRALKAIIVAVIAVCFCFGMYVALNKPGGGEFTKIDLAGIPQEGITLGDPDAPWTLVEFADPQCPFCHDHIGSAMPEVVDELVRSGQLKVRLQLMDFLGEDSTEAALFALAAAEQGKYWQAVEELYSRQGEEGSGWVTPELLNEISAQIGLDQEKLSASALQAQAALNTSKAQASELEVTSVPSFFIQRDNGGLTPLDPDGLDPESFLEALREAGIGQPSPDTPD